MGTAYGVESDPLVFEIPELEQLLFTHDDFIKKKDAIYIYTTYEAAYEAKKLLEEADLFENLHPLIVLNDGKQGENFFDFGFKTQNTVFLYKEMIIAFSIDGEDFQNKEMAKLQLEEHLVYSTAINSNEVFFVESNLRSLIVGILKAYQCKASFLDLDKWKKKL